jgi:crotonobetainyl-CoA:carnitine CoA-transferase CaiB-like acyl-CoA transferase
MTLGDLGADVLKIESLSGDEARGFGPPWLGGEGMNFMALNRNKRSIALDMKHADGRQVADRLCEGADVIIENFRPGVAERLGISHADLSERNPGLVYCSVSGFGRTGRNATRPALDLVLQGASGTLLRQGGDGPPTPIVITIADCYAASLATQAILGALLARTRDGLGQRIDVTLYEAMLAAQAYRVVSGAGDAVQLPAVEDIAPYGAFASADGWVTIAVVTDRSWAGLCSALELDDLAADERLSSNADRVAHKDALTRRVADEARRHTSAELLERLDRAGVPSGPVKRVEDLFFDEHVLDHDIIVELDHPVAGRVWTLGVPYHLDQTPLAIRRPAPTLSEHADEVLAELGLDADQIDALHESGAVMRPSTTDQRSSA